MDLKEIWNENRYFPSKVASIHKESLTTKCGYMSDIYFLNLHLANGDEVPLVMKTKLNSIEDVHILHLCQLSHERELKFYAQIYPELEQAMTELHLPSPLPKCYYAGVTTDGPVIVFEDLTRRGLWLPPMETDLSENDLVSILRSLARVQAGACALQLRRQASLLELFPFLKVSAKNFKLLNETFNFSLIV